MAKVAEAFKNVTSSYSDIEQQTTALVSFISMREASKNIVLMQVVRSLQGLLEDNIRRNLTVLKKDKNAAEQINVQRQNIVEAILSSDPEWRDRLVTSISRSLKKPC